ncbi:MAG: hypothetical protein VX498_07955 [Myxococcota bacterium]|nr:hypothetical protein [Myxococcota bacterium]
MTTTAAMITPRAHPGQHRLILLPVVGLFFVLRKRSQVATEAEREELSQAVRVQVLAGVIVLVHAVLQFFIGLVGWLWSLSQFDHVGQVGDYVPTVLLLATLLNVGAGAVEWLVAVVAGLRAAKGHPYPGFRQKKNMSDTAGGDGQK